MRDSDRISPTGYYTGYAWHRLGFPYGDVFVTRRGRAMFEAFRILQRAETRAGREPLLLRTLRNRHRVIDVALREHMPDRVVELAAGLSPRGVEWCLEYGTPYTELDLPGMVALKGRLFERRATAGVRAALAGRLSWRAQDLLAPAFEDVLRAELLGSQRPAIIAEGLLTHLREPGRDALLATIARVLGEHPRGIFLSDLRVRSLATAQASSALAFGIRVVTGGRTASQGLESHAAAAVVLERAGFDDVVRLPDVDTAQPPVMAGVWRAAVGTPRCLH